MRLLWVGVVAVLALAACGPSSTSGTAKGSPGGAAGSKPGGGTGGGGTGGGGTGGGGTLATLDITVSGAVSGHSTQLDTTQSEGCVEPGAAVTIGTYPMNLYPIINGKKYQFSMLIAKFKGPANITFPDTGNTVLLYLADKASGSTDLWSPGPKSTGSLVQNVDVISGHADIKGLSALLGNSTIDLVATWRCPPKK